MEIDFKKLKDEFKKNGFFKCKKIFEENFILELIDEIYETENSIPIKTA